MREIEDKVLLIIKIKQKKLDTYNDSKYGAILELIIVIISGSVNGLSLKSLLIWKKFYEMFMFKLYNELDTYLKLYW